MPQTPNVLALLKSIEKFAKDVPIDPESKRYEHWREDQKEILKACQKVLEVWIALKGTDVPLIQLPCGKILTRQAVLYGVPCTVRVNIKQPLSGHVTIDKVPLTKAIMDQLKAAPRKD